MVPMVNDSTGTPMQHNLNTGAELAVNYAVHNITVQAIISDILWNYNVVGIILRLNCAECTPALLGAVYIITMTY